MASLACIPTSLPLTPNKSSNSRLRFQQKPNRAFPFITASSDPIPKLVSSRNTSIITPNAVANKSAAVTPNPTSTIVYPPTKTKQTVEHIVLFKMKEGYNDYEVFIDAMNSLKCLPGVLYLSSGYIQDINHPTDGFNVFLHSRHASKDHLDKYMGHRLKYGFTMTYTEPYYQDYQIIDYVHEHDSPINHPAKGTALRTIFYKLKEGWGPSDKEKALEVANQNLAGSIDQQTFGDCYEGTTYRPAHKGYQVGSLALFPGVGELSKLKPPQEFAKELEAKLKGTLVPEGGVIVVDYEVKEAYNGDRDSLI